MLTFALMVGGTLIGIWFGYAIGHINGWYQARFEVHDALDEVLARPERTKNHEHELGVLSGISLVSRSIWKTAYKNRWFW